MSLQAPKVRLGPPNLGTTQEQLEAIRQLQKEVAEAEKEGREVVCIDESLFSSKGPKRPQWAPVGRPLEWDRRYFPDKYVAVCMATSTKRGVVHWLMVHG